MKQQILIIGGTGMLGAPVTRRLCAEGNAVRILTRTPDAARKKFGAEYEIVAGDVQDRNSLAQAMQGCQGVHISLNDRAIPDLERRGVENIVQVAPRAGVQRITYLSGASVKQENCWYAGTATKFAAEQAIRASGIPYTIFKATFFMDALPRFVRGTRASVIGNQSKPWHWVAANDYAQMVARAYAEQKAVDQDVYVLGPQAFTLEQALKTYCALVQPNATVSRLPLWLADLMARAFGQKELANALPFFRYTEKVGENADAAAVNALGAPTTTLEQWCQRIGNE
ncbi:MAG: NmrA family NAD(P)-binding protein [Chloroflexi bacterium]|nr:NmrA family NAD(P)-binding protein [Chloroflexota bacterium]